jgi:hypothetical protein
LIPDSSLNAIKYLKKRTTGLNGHLSIRNVLHINTIPCPSGLDLYPRIIKYAVLVKAFLLFITMRVAFLTHV